jgi:hypothetical protein
VRLAADAKQLRRYGAEKNSSSHQCARSESIRSYSHWHAGSEFGSEGNCAERSHESSVHTKAVVCEISQVQTDKNPARA